MTPLLRWSVAVAIIVLLLVGVLMQGDDWEYTPTSYGSIPGGYGAVHQLLTELAISNGRSFGEGAGLADGATVWWIAPNGLCSDVEAGDLSDAKSGVWNSLGWIEAGGTAVVFLPDARLHCFADIELAGHAVPLRAIDVEESTQELPGAAEGDGRDESEEQEELTEVTGPVHPEPRSLGTIPLRFFERSEGFDTLVQDEAGRSLVVAMSLGAGSLVFVATSAPLSNQWLDHADAALFAVDLALALGIPFIDEREHGLLPSPDPIRYLMASTALPAFVGAALLALATLWWGRAPLPPSIQSDSAPPPSLEDFVASIATLYASSRDYTSVLRSYQKFSLSQLRRSLLLPADVPTRRVCDRLIALRTFTEEELQTLFDPPLCRRASELFERVAELDGLLAKVAR